MRGLCHPGPFPEQRDRKWPGILGGLQAVLCFAVSNHYQILHSNGRRAQAPLTESLEGYVRAPHFCILIIQLPLQGVTTLWLCGFGFERRTSLLVQWVKQHSLSYSWTWHVSETHTLLDDGWNDLAKIWDQDLLKCSQDAPSTFYQLIFLKIHRLNTWIHIFWNDPSIVVIEHAQRHVRNGRQIFYSFNNKTKSVHFFLFFFF